MRRDPRATQARPSTRFRPEPPASPRLWLELLFFTELLLVALVFHYRTTSSITTKDYYAVYFALALVPLSLAVLWMERARIRVPIGFWLPLAFHIVLGTARVWMSPYAEHSWGSWRLSLSWMAAAIPSFVVARRVASVRRLLAVFTFAVWVVCCYALMQWIAYTLEAFVGWGEELDPVRWPWRDTPLIGKLFLAMETDWSYFRWERFPGWGKFPGVCSTFGNPTFLAGFLVILVPLYGALALSGHFSGRARAICWTTLALVAAAMGTTFSKGALLGALGGVGTLLLFLAWGPEGGLAESRRRLVRILAPVPIFLALFSLGVTFFFAYTASPDLRQDLGSVRNRAIVYSCTLDLIRDNLLLGVTPGNFVIRFPDYLEGALAEEYGWIEAPEEKVLEHVHNEFLEVWADLGILGLGGILAALVGWMRWCWRGWRMSKGSAMGWALAGLASGVVAALFENLASVSLRWTPSAWMVWAFIGAAAGLAASSPAIPPSLPPTSGLGRRFGVVGVSLVLAAALFAPSARRYSADWRFVNGRAAAALKTGDARAELSRCLELDPTHAQAHYILAGQLFAAEDYRGAIEHFQRVRELRGDVVVLAENMATAYFKLSTTLEKDFERQEALMEAIGLFEESLVRHPSFPRLEDYLARAYHRAGLERLADVHRRRAIDLYERWFKSPASHPRPEYALDLAKNYLMVGEHEKAFWVLRNARRWEGPMDKIQPVLASLVEAAPNYREVWDREENKLEAERVRSATSSATIRP
ncbi:MAG: hypothetical protein GHCLOJNM_01317 [bacterium]|nr:hypothetical protein [bacterium]